MKNVILFILFVILFILCSCMDSITDIKKAHNIDNNNKIEVLKQYELLNK